MHSCPRVHLFCEGFQKQQGLSMVENIDETTILLQRKIGQFLYLPQKIGVLTPNVDMPSIFPCSEALSAADAQLQATSTKLHRAFLYMSLAARITTRHMRCSAHMHAFFTKRKMYSRLRYIIFAFAAAPNFVQGDAPIAFSSQPTGSPSVQKQSSRCCCPVVRGRPWPKIPHGLEA